jgi:hypothetical protein
MSRDQESFEDLTKAVAQVAAQFDKRKSALDREVIAAAMISNAAALWAHNPVSRTRQGRRDIVREVSKLFDNHVTAAHKKIDKGLARLGSSPRRTSSASNRKEIEIAFHRPLNSIWQYAVCASELVALGR